MATHEPTDDMAQEVERQIQLAITAATLAARKAIAHRQATLAEAQAHSQARVAELRDQLDRQRTLARARIQPVFDSAWWENATPAQVGEMWQQSTQWRQSTPSELGGALDPTVFDRAADRIEQETRSRWQLDIYDAAALAHADDATELDRLAAARSTDSASRDTGVDPTPTPTESYDTRARRERLQQHMIAADVPQDAIQARVLADTAQARPISEAVQLSMAIGFSPSAAISYPHWRPFFLPAGGHESPHRQDLGAVRSGASLLCRWWPGRAGSCPGRR